MQALGFRQHGDMSVMELLNFPQPKAAAGEVVLEVKASAFNHLDIWVREGWPGLALEMPHISGSDAAGIVVEVGEGVKTFKIGDRLCLNPGINLYQDEFTLRGDHSESPGYHIIGEQLPGTHTQYISVPAASCLTIPAHISFETAAAAGLVSITAWRMLIHKAGIRLGDRVLIIGAGGGVNSIAIQLAKAAGADVYAVTSTPDKMKQAKELGVDHLLNYRENAKWSRDLNEMTSGVGFDVVVDNVGAATLNTSMKLVKRGGKIVIVGNTSGPKTEIDIRYIFGKQISIIGSTMGNHHDYLKVMNLVFNNKINPTIYKTIPLSDGVEAMAMLERGEQFGKIVLVS